MADLRTWAATHPDVGFVDMIHELDGDRDLMVSWVHLRGAANAIVARAFARELRAWLARHPWAVWAATQDDPRNTRFFQCLTGARRRR